jgi:hypothetical protein
LDLITADSTRYRKTVPLFGPIDPAKSTYKIMGTKLELTLLKADGRSWPTLRSDDDRVSGIFQVGPSKRMWCFEIDIRGLPLSCMLRNPLWGRRTGNFNPNRRTISVYWKTSKVMRGLSLGCIINCLNTAWIQSLECRAKWPDFFI